MGGAYDENFTLDSSGSDLPHVHGQLCDGSIGGCNKHREYFNRKRHHICISFGNWHRRWQWEHWGFCDWGRKRHFDDLLSQRKCYQFKRWTDSR